MAAKSVTTDLTTITLMEPGTTTADIGGGQSSGDETDFYIQGNQSFSRKVTGAGTVGGFGVNLASTLATGDHVFVWVNNLTPGLTQTTANGGVRVAVGASSAAYKQYYVNGSEDLIGGWTCYPFDPTLTADATQGNPGTTTTFFGALLATNGTINRSNLGIDAIRYGTGIDATGGGSPDPDITFDDIATEDALIANAFGILQPTAAGTTLQGRIRIGADDTTTSTTFTDVDAVLTKTNNNPSGVNTKTASNFSGIIVAGSQTTASFTGCLFIGLDTTDLGFFDSGSASNLATVTLSNTTFLDWGPTDVSTSTTTTGCSWKNCSSLTLNGGSISDCSFENSSPVIAGADLDNISNCSFTRGSAGHAITTTVSTGTLSLVGNSFSGYGSDGTSTAALNFTATSGSVTVNVSGGVIPTFLSAGVTVNLSLSSTLTLTGLKANTEVRIYDAGTTTEVAGVENSGTSESFSISVASVDVVLHNVGYIYQRLEALNTSANLTLPIQQQVDRNYDNPP